MAVFRAGSWSQFPFPVALVAVPVPSAPHSALPSLLLAVDGPALALLAPGSWPENKENWLLDGKQRL